MRIWIINWLLNAFGLMVVAHVLKGIKVASIGTALIAALVFGFVNATLGFILKIVTFPFEILTLGLMWLLINGLMLKLASNLVPGFKVQGCMTAVLGAILMSLLNLVFRYLLVHL